MLSYYLPFFVAPLIAALVLVGIAIRYLEKKSIVDLPNERSSHAAPIPRGGGLAVMPLILFGMGGLVGTQVLGFPNLLCWQTLVGFGMLLALVSWADDRHATGLPARWRLLAQGLAVAVPLMLLPAELQVFGDVLPLALERVLMGIAWVWFMNLYNFMDGINGITGMQTISITGGMIALTMLVGLPLESGIAPLNLIIAGTMAGFLFWNARSHAKVFLGDIGSIGLGYILGWLLILLALQGNLTVAILLPLVYLVDATVTLLRRLVQGKKLSEAHREHFYQRATHNRGLRHLQTTGMIFVTNLVLIMLAAFSLLNFITGWTALGIGLAVVCLLMIVFHKIGQRV